LAPVKRQDERVPLKVSREAISPLKLLFRQRWIPETTPYKRREVPCAVEAAELTPIEFIPWPSSLKNGGSHISEWLSLKSDLRKPHIDRLDRAAESLGNFLIGQTFTEITSQGLVVRQLSHVGRSSRSFIQGTDGLSRNQVPSVYEPAMA
jgi:hypothetical protein